MAKVVDKVNIYSGNVFLRRQFSLLRKRNLREMAIKAYKLWRREGLKGIYEYFTPGINYNRWIEINDTLDLEDRKQILLHIDILAYRPVISVVLLVHNAPRQWLTLAIESVRQQLYQNWELCIAFEASNESHIMAVTDMAESDSRIKIVCCDGNADVLAVANSAKNLVAGEFVALLSQDDVLAEHALYMVAVALNKSPDLDLIYTDEDKVDEFGERFAPYLKPDWNPDLFLNQGMRLNLCVLRTKIMHDVGGFGKYSGALRNWDFLLRITEIISAAHIKHIPQVLYHVRCIGRDARYFDDIVNEDSKLRVAAVQEHLKRTGQSANVSVDEDGIMHIQYSLPEEIPLVSIIIPVRNKAELLECCINSLFNKTDYKCFEILIVDNQSDDPETLMYLASLQEAGVALILKYDKPFNFSAINNYAAQFAKGSVLCFMNNDIEVISNDWLNEMVGHAIRNEIGAVGAMLYYPDNTIQHAGVLVGMGGCAGHLYVGCPRGINGYAHRAKMVQNMSAVTAACLVVRKSVFFEVGGFDSEKLSVAFNDVDFCLKLVEQGYRNLWTPFAEFYHHESASRGRDDTPDKQQRFQCEISYMQSRWVYLLNNDPAYNPNLTLEDSMPYLASTPRVIKPWQSN